MQVTYIEVQGGEEGVFLLRLPQNVIYVLGIQVVLGRS